MPKLTAISSDWHPSGPVRKIGIQTRSITGTLPDGSRYESSLERDFMLLLQFDGAVDVFTPQPITIPYRGLDGLVHRYTPDGMIEWRSDVPVEDSRPMLVEVKYREAFIGEWRRWRHKIRAIRRFAEERDWVFRVFTETDIRTPYLENARFLLPYRRRETTSETEDWVLRELVESVDSTPAKLVSQLYQDKWNQAGVLPVIWKLMAEKRIGFDVTAPLSMDTAIWSTLD